MKAIARRIGRIGGLMVSLLELLRRDPRRAIQEESITCLVCGNAFRQLTNTHLRSHQITSLEYKQRFGYNLGRPLMCRALQRLYAERATHTGLASYIRRRPIVSNPELRRRGGYRPVALEERLNRREVQLARNTGFPAGKTSPSSLAAVSRRISN